jgi:soluble lytic murein transglycosylase-like protein
MDMHRTLKTAGRPKYRRLVLAAAMAFLSSPYAGSASMAANLNVCEREMIAASTRYKVPLGVLYAVGMTETGRKGSLQPYALNIEGKTVFTNSERAAMKSFKVARLTGKKLIDLGCMQVNHHYHGDKFSSVEEMLDPQKNVEYAAKFLSELRVQEGSWTMAVARYHAGPNNNIAQKRYVCLVIKNLVASDFGAWTPEAKKFCR